MVDEHDVRALVGHERKTSLLTPKENPPRWRPSKHQVLRVARLTAAVLVVLGSMAVAGWLLYSEFGGTDEDAAEVATTSPAVDDQPDGDLEGQDPTPAPVVEPTATAVAPVEQEAPEPFEELRYLPAGDSGDLELQSIIRVPAAAPLITLVRTSNETITGILFVDLVDVTFEPGIGLSGLREVTVAGEPALITGTGPVLSQVVSFDHSKLGTLRAWGLGITETEHVEILETLLERFTAPETELPDSWQSLMGYNQAPRREIWRAYYRAISGEIAVVATTETPGSTVASCIDDGCPMIRTMVDDDDVEVAAIASPARLDDFNDSLRSTSQHNARVRNNEFEPLGSLTLADARSLLYVPKVGSEWVVTETRVHASGAGVTQPAMVLAERETPEIGPITSAVVVHIDPVGTNQPFTETLPGDRTLLIADRDVFQLRIEGWQHSIGELEIGEELITIGDDGFEFASRAASSLGLERRYDVTRLNPFPLTIREGAVFAATVENDVAGKSLIRVSRVPSYVPEAVAVQPHDNERVTVTLRGQSASQIVHDGVVTLAWEEVPGVLITLTGADEGELLQLAESLELADRSDLIVDSSSEPDS